MSWQWHAVSHRTLHLLRPIFHWTMILGFLGAHPPNATPSPKKYGLYQKGLRDHGAQKNPQKRAGYFLGGKGGIQGGGGRGCGSFRFWGNTSRQDYSPPLFRGLHPGWAVDPTEHEPRCNIQRLKLIGSRNDGTQGHAQKLVDGGIVLVKNWNSKKNSSEDEVIYGMYVIYDIEKNMGLRRWIFWTTTFAKELILISLKFCWGLFNESVLKTKRSYIFLLPTTTRQTHLKAENAGAVLVTDGSNGLWGATGIAHIAIVAWTEFAHLKKKTVTYKYLVSSKTIEIVSFQKKKEVPKNSKRNSIWYHLIVVHNTFATPSCPNDGGQVLPREASHQFHGATCHISQEVRIVVSFWWAEQPKPHGTVTMTGSTSPPVKVSSSRKCRLYNWVD